MNKKPRHSGLTLTETIVVISIVAVFTVLGLPAIRAFVRSIESEGGTKAMISASLSSARAMAAQKQRYAGVRFQNKYQPDGKGCQYMIFIVQDPKIMAYGFRAVEGIAPMKLPDSVGVMEVVGCDSDIDDATKLANKTTFSVIFSPSGKLVIHDVQTRNRNGQTNNSSKDDIFNTQSNVQNGIGMFYQDDYPSDGFDKESSRNSFRIYDKTVFDKVNPLTRYTDYLRTLDVIYINPYTGTIINK